MRSSFFKFPFQVEYMEIFVLAYLIAPTATRGQEKPMDPCPCKDPSLCRPLDPQPTKRTEVVAFSSYVFAGNDHNKLVLPIRWRCRDNGLMNDILAHYIYSVKAKLYGT